MADAAEPARSAPEQGAAAPEKPAPAPAPSPDKAPAEKAPVNRMVPAKSEDQRILLQEELSWRELDELDRDHTVFFLTVAPLEEHGPHLPVGTDSINTQLFAGMAAKHLCTHHAEWTVVVAPPLPVGSDTFEYVGSVDIRRRVVRDLLVDYMGSLAHYGFRHFVILSTHCSPGHTMAIDEACHQITRRHGATAFAPMPRILRKLFTNSYRDAFRKALGKNGEALDFSTDHHAGHWETSMMLYYRPELIDPGYTRLKPVTVDPSKIDEQAALTQGDRLGYFGAPALASREVGRISTAIITRELVEMFFQAQKDPAFLEEFAPPLFDIYRVDFTRAVLAILLTLLALATWALFG